MTRVPTFFSKTCRVGVLLLAGAFLVAFGSGCKGGGSGGRIERVCEDFCERSVGECLDIKRGVDDCVSVCEDDFELADELDGNDCVDAQVIAFECLTDRTCEDIFFYSQLKESQRPTSFCTTEIDNVVTLCPESVELSP